MEWTTLVDVAHDAVITVGDEVGETFLPTIQLKDYAGNNMKVASSIFAYMSDVATGLDPSADMNGEVAKTSGGNGDVTILLANCAYQLVSETDGTISLTITDTSGTGNKYLVLVMPDGRLVVSDAMLFTE